MSEELRAALRDCEPIYEGEAGHPPETSYKVPEWLVLRIDAALAASGAYYPGAFMRGRVTSFAKRNPALAASGATLTDYQRGYVDGFDAPRNIEARAASGATLDVDRIARAFREAQLEDWRGRNYTDAHEWAEAIVEADARLSGAVTERDTQI